MRILRANILHNGRLGIPLTFNSINLMHFDIDDKEQKGKATAHISYSHHKKKNY